MDTILHDTHKSLITTWMITQELTNATNFTNLALRGAFFLKI